MKLGYWRNCAGILGSSGEGNTGGGQSSPEYFLAEGLAYVYLVFEDDLSNMLKTAVW